MSRSSSTTVGLEDVVATPSDVLSLVIALTTLFLAVTNTCLRLLEPEEDEPGVTTTVVADFEDPIEVGIAPLEDCKTLTTLVEV